MRDWLTGDDPRKQVHLQQFTSPLSWTLKWTNLFIKWFSTSLCWPRRFFFPPLERGTNIDAGDIVPILKYVWIYISPRLTLLFLPSKAIIRTSGNVFLTCQGHCRGAVKRCGSEEWWRVQSQWLCRSFLSIHTTHPCLCLSLPTSQTPRQVHLLLLMCERKMEVPVRAVLILPLSRQWARKQTVEGHVIFKPFILSSSSSPPHVPQCVFSFLRDLTFSSPTVHVFCLVQPYLKSWSQDLGVPILSVDYSLAPEAPFPRALEECFYAYCWALRNHHLLGTHTSQDFVHERSCAAVSHSLWFTGTVFLKTVVWFNVNNIEPVKLALTCLLLLLKKFNIWDIIWW